MQIFSWFIVPAIKSLSAENKHNVFAVIVLVQYIARLYLVFSLSHQIILTSEVVAKIAWVGAAYNLLLCLIASHVSNFTIFLLFVTNYLEKLELRILLYFCNCHSFLGDNKFTMGFNSIAGYRSCLVSSFP